MNKAILVIDMPSSCKECMMTYTGYHSDFCFVTRNIPSDVGHYVFTNTKPNWCPLKEVPDRKVVDWLADNAGWSCGWNACIEEILESN